MSADPGAPPARGFDSLGLAPPLLTALEEAGFARPTPIQALALPPMLAGRDVLGRAQTGSGKTVAFGLALLQRLKPGRAAPQALVLCPTRELADQVASALRGLARRMPHTRVLTLCGGRPFRHQHRSLSGGVHVVVGTPGRVNEHLERGTLDPSALRTVVLDEADRLLDMGFLDQVTAAVSRAPAGRLLWLFSATFSEPVLSLSRRLQQAPVAAEVAAPPTPEHLRQAVIRCAPRRRLEVLQALLLDRRAERALVFCETRRGAEATRAALASAGIDALALHGDMAQRERDGALVRFANGSARVLVATDVAARGLDIEALPLVISLSPPGDAAWHVHRVGRTARAGASGEALTLAAEPEDLRRLAAIEALLGASLPEAPPPPAASVDLPAPMRTILVLGGRRDRLRPGDLLGALTSPRAGHPLAGTEVGRVTLRERCCYVAVRREVARRALAILRRGRIKGRRFRVAALW